MTRSPEPNTGEEMFGSKNPDDRPRCNVEKCGLPMFSSGSFWLCSKCDMVTEEEIAARKA